MTSKPLNQEEERNPRGIIHSAISTPQGPIRTIIKSSNSNRAASISEKLHSDPSIPKNTILFPSDTMNFASRKEGEIRISTWNIQGIKSAYKKVVSFSTHSGM